MNMSGHPSITPQDLHLNGRAGHLSSNSSELGGLHAVLSVVRKQLWVFLYVSLAVVVYDSAFGVSQKKIFQARSTIQIDPKPPAPMGRNVENVVDLGAGSYWASQEYYNTQHRIISSKPIALIAVRNLGLNVDPKFIENTAEAPKKKIEPISPEDAADILLSRLSVNPVKESQLVEVTYEDADKLRAVRILEAVLQAYVEHNIDQTIESTSAAATWLGEQLDTLRKELSESELALHEYKLDKQIPTIGLEDQASVLLKEMQDLTSARTEARTRLQHTAARLAQLKKIDANQPESIPQSELLQSHELDTLRTEFIAAKREVSALKDSGKGEQHPEMLAAQGKLAVTSKGITSVVQNIVAGVEHELGALKQEESGISALLKAAEDEALDLNLMEIEYTRLKRTKDNNEKLYSLVLERSKETNLTQMLRVNNVKILAPAEADDRPVKPRLALILAVGLIAGLGLGGAAGAVRERFDQTIKSSDELEQRSNLTSLGVIPDIGQSRSGKIVRRRGKDASNDPIELIPLRDPAGGVAEAVRNIRTNLLFMSPDRPFKRLLVTSAGPAEGKTTLACYLGIAMAQAGQRVLLVDCDMRRPRLQVVFKPQRGDPTVSSALLDLDNQDFETLASNVPNLSVMHAGPMPPNPAELLHSDKFRKLLDRLSGQYDLVLLDSPPLVVTDAAIMSTLVDGTILVVRALQTDLSSIQRALRSLTDVGGHVVGGVLNGAQHRKGRYGYGYYGYGTYGNGNTAVASDEPSIGS